jgi:hypothetical protein
MSNAILPLALLGSMGSSAAAVAYGISTDWKFMKGEEKDPAPIYTPPPEPQGLSGSSSMMVDDFVIQSGGDDDDMTLMLDPNEASSETAIDASGDTKLLTAISSVPVNCTTTDEGEQTALQGFSIASIENANKYAYTCYSLENPGDVKFGLTGAYVSSQRGSVAGLHNAQALCASNQALVSFVLDENKSGTKAGYRYDCINLKGPAKVRTALTGYKPYDDANELGSLKGIGEVKCNEDELLQGFALEKSGNNMRYIYRCVTPGYEEE